MYGLGAIEFRTKQRPTGRSEVNDVARGKESVQSRSRRDPIDTPAREDRLDIERGLLGRRDEDDLWPHHVRDRPRQKRVVRASEQQGVDFSVDQRREEPLGQDVHLVTCDLAALDELDEARTGETVDPRLTGKRFGEALVRAKTAT